MYSSLAKRYCLLKPQNKIQNQVALRLRNLGKVRLKACRGYKPSAEFRNEYCNQTTSKRGTRMEN